MASIKPVFSPTDFNTAAPEVLVAVSLAFKDGSFFKDDVLAELGAD